MDEGPELALEHARFARARASRIAVVARAPEYPWERRIYWIAEGAGIDTDLRPTDSLQLLLHTMDHIAGPGAVARARREAERRGVELALSVADFRAPES